MPAHARSAPGSPSLQRPLRCARTLTCVAAGLLLAACDESSAHRTDRSPASHSSAAPSSTGHARPSSRPNGEIPTPTSAPADTAAQPRGHGRRMRVVRVVDGDTVKLAPVAGAGLVTVRLLGIDTPETKDPRKGVGCFGPQASSWAAGVLTGTVSMRGDPTQDERDRYGRTLAYLTLPDGKDYSIEAARRGYAKHYVYDRPVSEASAIRTAENQAHNAGRGLWGAPCYGHTDAAPKAVTTSQAPKHPAARSGSARYENCDAARASGVAPLHRGEPGYSRKLDRDGDGIACER